MSRLGLLFGALKRIVWHAVVAPVARPRAFRDYWASLVWAAANGPDAGRAGAIPEATLEEIVPETMGVSCDLRDYLPVYGSVTPDEIVVLARVVRALRPRRMFEIGTYNGGTSVQLAANAPAQARIWTMDLPPDHPLRRNENVADVVPEVAGEKFLHSRWSDRIELILADSRTFDFAPYAKSMDLVFVDGSHAREYVRSDSRAALSMAAPGGVVVWHDYAAHASGVVMALDALAKTLALRRVRGTSLVIHRAPPDSPAPRNPRAP